MAKLSSEVLSEGRRLIRQSDLEGINAWVRTHAPLVDQKVISDTLEKVFRAGDTEKALKMFNAGFENYDHSVEVAGSILRFVIPAFLFLGGLGGFLYLCRLLFGH